MPRLFEKIAEAIDAWRDRWEARPRRPWQWWRPEPTQWHEHDPRRRAYAENGKPLIGVRVQRRWNGEQWEYRLYTDQSHPEPAHNQAQALLAKSGTLKRHARKRRRSKRDELAS